MIAETRKSRQEKAGRAGGSERLLGEVESKSRESEAWLWVSKTSAWGYGMTRSKVERGLTGTVLGHRVHLVLLP